MKWVEAPNVKLKVLKTNIEDARTKLNNFFDVQQIYLMFLFLTMNNYLLLAGIYVLILIWVQFSITSFKSIFQQF